MTEFKLVVSDPKEGKTFQKEFGEDALKKIKGAKIGDEIDGGIFGLPGYKLLITGGSDGSGFPMRLGIHGTRRSKALLAGGVGYKPKESVRKRKRVRGEQVNGDVAQLNTKITKAGQRPITELLGVEAKEEGGDEKTSEDSAEKPGKPAETPKEAAKPQESPEKPAETESKKEEPPAEAKDEKQSAGGAEE